ncbi:DUF2007 domain-containing protein [Salinimicrobium oceani]|uniref:DUF2007 domain-containing protein n=1 Tax=Salinimicrobium oceani TaxID=2722702 RepID=A0ABX1CYW3_9FLAO|nr:DUF2007 domain-containing protein [Salinimicrobium oceani]NJW52957.1 DUF2007 domain-containing protein [Salinimicrobium oceani]
MSGFFSTVAVFQYSAEAEIIKGRLQSEGFECFLTDNHTIDTDPLVSNAIGGVKLNVRKEDETGALHVLNSIKKFAVDDEGLDLQCQYCNSKEVELLTKVKGFRSIFFFGLSFLFNALPIYIKRDYHCRTCNMKFDLK